MKHEPWLEKWSYEDDKVILEYVDGATLRVAREDFIRAFGVIIGLTKAEAEKEYGIKNEGDNCYGNNFGSVPETAE